MHWKKGQIYTGIVSDMEFPNKGIVEVQPAEETETAGKATVKNALPGQTVSFRLNKKRGDRVEGRLLEVLKRAECEDMAAACPLAGVCGGCLYQGFPYEESLKIREKQIRSLLGHYVEDAIYDGIQASPDSEGYRNKMEYTFGDEYQGGPLTLGLHKRGSFYDICDASGCRLADRDFGRLVAWTQEYFRGTGLAAYHRMKHSGYLRHLLVRKAVNTGEILVALVTTSSPDSVQRDSRLSERKKTVPVGEGFTEADEAVKVLGEGSGREEYGAFLAADATMSITKQDGCREEHGAVDDTEAEKELTGIIEHWAQGVKELSFDGALCGILHIINDSPADAVLCDRMELLEGRDYFEDQILNLRFRISPFSFFQTNTKGAELLYDRVRSYLKDASGVVFDLYSGTGTIAQLMAPAAGKVIGVEIVEAAVEAAKINAKENGLTNCSFIAGDVLKVLDSIEEKPDVIILDPPRDGIHPKALGKILNYGVEHIVYISCKASSLARDLEMISGAGYLVERWGMTDMFPYTGNVETVVSLSKNFAKPKDYIQIGIDAEDYYRIKDAERE